MEGRAEHVAGIDVGGSAIKGFVVDVGAGTTIGPGARVEAPAGFGPEEVLAAVAGVADELGPELPVGVGFPAVVGPGAVLLTNPTSHERPGWKGLAIEDELGDRLGRPVAVGNDADVAGEAEVRLGAARGVGGTVLVLTFGTGIGSALYRDGVLVPNVELGRVYLRGHDAVAEDHCAGRVRTELGLSWEEWAARLGEYLAFLERVFAPGLIVVGGGISADHERFLPLLETRCELRVASFRNEAGPIGAAMLAASRLGAPATQTPRGSQPSGLRSR